MPDSTEETKQAGATASLEIAGVLSPTAAVLPEAPENFTHREPEGKQTPGEGLGAGLKDILESMEEGIKQNWLGVNAAIVDTAGSLSAAVESSMHSAEGAIHDGTEAMERAFDFPEQVRQNAWLMVGGAVFLGVLLGFWIGRARS